MQTVTTQNNDILTTYRTKGLQLFYTNGYNATDIKTLYETLQIKPDRFEMLFKNKEEFFMGILQNLLFPQILDLLADSSKLNESPFKLLLNIFGQAIENGATYTNDRGSILAVFLAEFKEKDCRIAQYIKDIYKIWHINLTALLKRGKALNYVNKHVNCDAAAHFILASYFGTRGLLHAQTRSTQKEEFLEQLSNYFYALAPMVY